MLRNNPRTHSPQQKKKPCWRQQPISRSLLLQGRRDNNCASCSFFYQKGCFWYKTYIGISLGTKFQLKLTVLIFWTKFAQKVNITIEFCIFEIVYVPNFSLNWQVGFFWPNLPKKCVSGLNRKSEHDHWILHVRISLGTKFQLKLTILIFWTKV